jgi:hypothetical protein
MAVMGTFAYEEDFLAAAKALKSSGFERISLLSPLRRRWSSFCLPVADRLFRCRLISSSRTR